MTYPNGRWTTRENHIRNAALAQRIPLFAQPAAALLRAPLRELFWGLPESSLLEEARQRVETVVAIALAKAPTQTELALA